MLLCVTQKPFLSTGTVLRCPELYEVDEPEETMNLTITCTRSLETSLLSLVNVISQDGTATGWFAVVTMNC